MILYHRVTVFRDLAGVHSIRQFRSYYHVY
jgi:hypothetical protein